MWLAGFSIFIKHIFSHESQTHDNHSTFFIFISSQRKQTKDNEGILADNNYAIAVGNSPFRNFMNSTAEERGENAAMTQSIAAVIHASGGGEDLSRGATFWDHSDLRTNSSHEKRLMGLQVNYSVLGGWGPKTITPHTSVLGTTNGNYLLSTPATSSRAIVTYTYETTRGIGTTVFTRVSTAARAAGQRAY
ncbi:hypothetical protein [Terrimonas pollutisoli]|uniref:hypothetical protein n=1 Tax=Terrimonas pollutisoli TaxID=3034147 RepID=UPI0023EB64B7|nr:hypothetical protein [Terrimonas sp. H1YJ31]